MLLRNVKSFILLSHDALQQWPDKPWFYRPEPPSRRFSWRKLTNFVYPFCSWYGERDGDRDDSLSLGIQATAGSPSDAYDNMTSSPCNDMSLSTPYPVSDCDHQDSAQDAHSSVLQDITNIPNMSNGSYQGEYGAPLSVRAVLSSLPEASDQGWLEHLRCCRGSSRRMIENKENIESHSLMQIGQPCPSAYKNSPMNLQQAFQMQAFQEGHVQQNDETYNDDDFGQGEAEGPSPGDSSGSSQIGPPSVDDHRQDVMLFHLDDRPIRSLISWNSYEDMMVEIAHHFALQREDLVDVYEVVVSPPDIGNNVVPTIVHINGDVNPESAERLVLIDVEYHAHRIERNFRYGPNVLRCVKPVPQTVTRNQVLFHANIDRYCRHEQGRCLVFINDRRWPDYDLDRKTIAHGDYIRIAVPPSDRFSCATVALSDMIQRGFSDQQILDEIYPDDVASGYSPSLLNEEETRSLATQYIEDTDEVPMMQWSLDNSQERNASIDRHEANDSSDVSIPQDWFVDLQRLVHCHCQNVDDPVQPELLFPVLTWFIDHGTSRICREPRIVMLGDDPSEWRDDILEPWRHYIRREDTALIDLVSPFVPRAGIEDHIAHIIITQRPVELNSVLFSMEFVDALGPSVTVRFAIAVEPNCSPQQIAEIVPLYGHFALNQQTWIHPVLDEHTPLIKTRFGLGINVQIFPEAEVQSYDSPDSSSLLQQCVAVSKNTDGASGEDDCGSDRLHADSSIECCFDCCSHACDEKNIKIGSRRPHPVFIDFSLTEEFIRYIQAVGTQGETDPALLERPDGLSDQPTWVQDLWEKWVETAAHNGEDLQNGPRLETWFTNPRRWTRCEHSRVVVLSSNFQQWERELLAAWTDRADRALPTQFAIVFPTPPDADRTAQEQLVIEQQSEPFSRTIVVTVCDTARSSGRHGSIALVVSDRLETHSLVTLLGYSEICPPERTENECILWMGNIAIRQDQVLNVRNGNALRFLVRRGIRVGIPELLSMSDGQLRLELQAAIEGAIFRRPNVQGFPADPNSMNNPSSSYSSPPSGEVQYPPDWFNALQVVFDHEAFVENSDEGSILYVLVWFVNGMPGVVTMILELFVSMPTVSGGEVKLSSRGGISSNVPLRLICILSIQCRLETHGDLMRHTSLLHKQFQSTMWLYCSRQFLISVQEASSLNRLVS